MAAYELKYTAEEIDGILESVDKKTIYDDATQSEHGLMSTTDKAKVDAIPADPKYTDTVYDDTALSGRVSTIEGKESGWDAKQDALVSGTNIKTVNGESLLGSGDIEIQGGGGEENVIEVITMNGASVPVTNKTAAITETDPTVPSWAKQPNKPSYNYSEIGNTPDLSGFITKSVNDLTNYYLKSETYTKAEVAALIGAIQQFHYEIYPTLPASGKSNVLYLIGPTGSGSDRYEEYVYSNNAFTKIGDTSIDLSGYVTTSALNTALASYATTQDLDDTKVFWAEVNVTPFADIKDAVDAGRTVMLKDEDGYQYVLSYIDDTYISFSCSSGDEMFIKTYNVYDDDSWELLAVYNMESQGNKVSSISSSSNNTQYPSAKAVYDIVSTKYTKPQGGIPASDLASGVIPDISGKEDNSNKVSTISGNEAATAKYPNTKAVADALGKWGVVSQTQTWSGTGTQPRTYVMSDLVYGTIPQANIDLFESAGATFNATTGYFELNGLTDISYEEMRIIYNTSIDNLSYRVDRQYQYYAKKLRTMLPFYFNTYTGFSTNWSSIFAGGCSIERISSTADTVKFVSASGTMFRDCNYLKEIPFVLDFVNKTSSDGLVFYHCYSLEKVLIKNLKIALDFKDSSLLGLDSFVYIVENAANTSAITITLHADALARCTADTTEYTYNSNTYTGIVALANAKNITLASA